VNTPPLYINLLRGASLSHQGLEVTKSVIIMMIGIDCQCYPCDVSLLTGTRVSIRNQVVVGYKRRDTKLHKFPVIPMQWIPFEKTQENRHHIQASIIPK
jgi:hypothetical protein